MYFRGEDVIMEQREGSILLRQLYLQGTNLVPKVLFPEEKGLYGVIDSWSCMHIDREWYYEIAGGMRKMIEGDFSYRIFLKRKTNELLERFAEETEEFEHKLNNGELSAEWLKESLDFYAIMLSLLEYNGMMPYHWYERNIEELSDKALRLEDFTYTKDFSHRVYLYREKLKLVKALYNCIDFNKEPLVNDFEEQCNYLSDKGDPMLWDFSEKRKELCEELEQMRNMMTPAMIDDELDRIQRNRIDNKRAYYDKLRRLNDFCIEKGYSTQETFNMIHAFMMISFACNEEEQRHFLQDKYWFLLNKLFKKLELPGQFVTIDALIIAVRQYYGI